MLTLLNEEQLENNLEQYKPFTLFELQLEQRHRRSSLFLADHPKEHWIDILTGAKKGSPSNFTYENSEYILECELDNNPDGIFIIENIVEAYYEELEEEHWKEFYNPSGDMFPIMEAAIETAKVYDEFSKEALEFLENTSKYQPKMRTGNITPWLENEEVKQVMDEAYHDYKESEQSNGIILNESNGYLLIARWI
jgi:hypothetical protein